MISATSILGSFDIARRALTAHQTTLDTIGHNLANVNTPGYSRQRAELAATSPRLGVDVQTITRARDRFLDLSLLNEQQMLGRDRTQDSVLQRLESVFNDPPDTGLSATLDQLFQSLQALSVTPTDQVARVAVVDQAQRLTATLHDMRARVDQLQSDITSDIQAKVTSANSLMTQIADANRQIVASQGGPAPNDILDRRDGLITQLNDLVGVTATDRADGSVQLAMTGSGVLLVDGLTVAPLVVTHDVVTDTVNLTAGAAATAVAPTRGALGALVDLRNRPTGPVKQAMSDLDAFAQAVATEVNRVHTQGAGLTEFGTLTAVNAASGAAVPLATAGLPDTLVDGTFDVVVHNAAGAVTATATIPITAGTTTLDDVATALAAVPGLSASVTSGRLTITAAPGSTFAFAKDTAHALSALGLNTFFSGTSAATLAVTPLIAGDPSKIAASLTDASGLVHPGDGTNALALARLRTGLVMSGTMSFTDFFAAAVGRVGSATRDAAQELDRQQAAVQVVQGMQQQASGVSIDEEMISLTQSQTAYAAAARFATTVNDMLATLLAMGT